MIIDKVRAIEGINLIIVGLKKRSAIPEEILDYFPRNFVFHSQFTSAIPEEILDYFPRNFVFHSQFTKKLPELIWTF